MEDRSILCVDDEAGVLDGLRRNLRRDFDVTTAVGGAEALATLERAPFQVVVSDYQMPEMNGAEFLGHVRERWPEMTRVLLTGNADMDAAIHTVNEGQIFRFLLKPCPKEALIPALEAALDYNRLVVSERVLLQDTLHGTIRLLVDALSLVSPEAFGSCGRVATQARCVAEELGVDAPWKVEMATLLSQVTLVTLPPETLEKVRDGDELRTEEQEMVERLPSVGRDLITPLPRIEDVRDLVECQGPPWGSGAAPAAKRPVGAAILRACVDLDLVMSQGVPFAAAIHTLRQRNGFYPDQVLAALEKHPPTGTSECRQIDVLDVAPGMVLLDSIQTVDGRLLVASGNVLTPTMVERVRNFCANTPVKEPIRVSV